MQIKEYKKRFAGRTPESKIILDLCGGTGAWSKPYADAGYNVINITLPDYDITETGIVNNYHWGFHKLYFHKEDATHLVNIPCVYGILAAPPCQHFSFARQNAKSPRDISGAFEIVKKCREIIEACAIHGNLKFWAIENPRGYLSRILGKPPFSFERHEFGDDGIKKTFVWGNFTEPKKTPKLELRDPKFMEKDFWDKVKIPKGYRKNGWDSKAIKRAMTPPRFAKAFFEANQ